MPNLDRRELLHAGIAFAAPMGFLSLLGGNQPTVDDASNDQSSQVSETNKSNIDNPKQDDKGKTMHIQYLEIVTPEVDALCKQYSTSHGVEFGEPEMNLGNARTAELKGGGMIGIRGPLRETETPVIRPYVLVEDLEKAVAAAADAGAEIALPRMEIPEFATIAIVIQGGIECGLWQSLK